MSDADEDGPELTSEDRRVLKRIADRAREEWPDRRQAVAGGAAALLGGATFAAGRASADASTSDGDGDVGQPGNRVDGFFDGVNANSVDAARDNQWRFWSRYNSIQDAITTEHGRADRGVFIDYVRESASDEIEESAQLVAQLELRGYGIQTKVTTQSGNTVEVPAGENDGHIHHLWINNNSGTGNGDAIHLAGNEWCIGPLVDVDVAGRYGIYLTGERHYLSDVSVQGGGPYGVYLDTGCTKTVASNLIINATRNAGLGVDGDNNYIDATIQDNNSNGAIINGNGNFLSIAAQNNAQTTSNPDIEVGGNQNDLTVQCGWMQLSTGATENVVGGRIGTLDRGGTRNIVNGVGWNNGDPNSTGDWNGSAAFAYRHGATVWDTSTSPWTPYLADEGGNWVSI